MELEVDEKCTGCGACVADCPVGVPAVRYARTAYRHDGARVEFI